jgi:hypothetical protein
MKYSIDNVCTGNYKADIINSEIMEVASDIATHLTELDCAIEDIVCYTTEIEGDTSVLSFTEEAQSIFDEHYDIQTDRLYNLINKCIDIVNENIIKY